MAIGMNNLGSNGRLGNQMFQYASLVGIAKNRGFNFVIPDHSKSTTFDYYDDNWKTVVTVNHQLQHCFKMINSEGRYGLIDGDEVEIHESHEFCQDLYNECPDNVTLNGYLQTEKYFSNVEHIIREDFSFKEVINFYVESMYGEYLKQNPVSIVVRNFSTEFDYTGCENNHKNLPFSYYKKSIEMMGKDRLYLICSNNIDLCKKQEVFCGDNFIFVDKIPETINKAHFDLCLSSKCKDFIISNSTFSWWAAWLGSDKNKRVISPISWYGPNLSHINTNDLYPNGWEKI